jgi:hypothetical protein
LQIMGLRYFKSRPRLYLRGREHRTKKPRRELSLSQGCDRCLAVFHTPSTKLEDTDTMNSTEIADVLLALVSDPQTLPLVLFAALVAWAM